MSYAILSAGRITFRTIDHNRAVLVAAERGGKVILDPRSVTR